MEFYKKKKSSKKTDKLLLKKMGVSTESEIDFDIDFVKTEIIKMEGQNISITNEDKEKLRILFEIMGIQFLPAIAEGEATCSYLNHWGLVDGVMTEDSDSIAYGCSIFISKFNTGSGTCCVIETDHLLKKMNITREQLLDFCIMLQCDYNQRIPKVGPVNSFKLIMEHKSLDVIENQTSHNLDCLKYKRCRELFTCIQDTGEYKINYSKPPDFGRLEEFIEVNNLNVQFEKIKQSCIPQQISVE